eukprot:TRINITY_DN3982_c0_g1_i1.p1 TRINITY_DN3982_c0_g1~~TRINITY_DN3982_c0_g1_i1.p1  ORF type:complete len:616 (+),score=101.25 TRINITY_DN3982_c0_g1_i1:153-2000(+)
MPSLPARTAGRAPVVVKVNTAPAFPAGSPPPRTNLGKADKITKVDSVSKAAVVDRVNVNSDRAVTKSQRGGRAALAQKRADPNVNVPKSAASTSTATASTTVTRDDVALAALGGDVRKHQPREKRTLKQNVSAERASIGVVVESGSGRKKTKGWSRILKWACRTLFVVSYFALASFLIFKLVEAKSLESAAEKASDSDECKRIYCSGSDRCSFDVGSGRYKCLPTVSKNSQVLELALGIIFGIPAVLCAAFLANWLYRILSPGLLGWHAEMSRQLRVSSATRRQKAEKTRMASKGEVLENAEEGEAMSESEDDATKGTSATRLRGLLSWLNTETSRADDIALAPSADVTDESACELQMRADTNIDADLDNLFTSAKPSVDRPSGREGRGAAVSRSAASSFEDRSARSTSAETRGDIGMKRQDNGDDDDDDDDMELFFAPRKEKKPVPRAPTRDPARRPAARARTGGIENEFPLERAGSRCASECGRKESGMRLEGKSIGIPLLGPPSGSGVSGSASSKATESSASAGSSSYASEEMIEEGDDGPVETVDFFGFALHVAMTAGATARVGEDGIGLTTVAAASAEHDDDSMSLPESLEPATMSELFHSPLQLVSEFS